MTMSPQLQPQRLYPNTSLIGIILTCLTAMQPAVAQSGTESFGSKPNVVVIFADDLGPGDVNTYHKERTGKASPIPTPTMDRLIQSGIRFDDAHAPNSLCAPSRFSMLTGNYSWRKENPLEDEERNLLKAPKYRVAAAELLKTYLEYRKTRQSTIGRATE